MSSSAAERSRRRWSLAPTAPSSSTSAPPPLTAAERALDNAFAACARRDEDAWPTTRPAAGIAATEIIWRLAAQFCDARALCALGTAAAPLYTASCDVVPRLAPDVTLYPHQRRGLRFMLRKEKSGRGGGLLCDEPGTGKTLTVVALLLRTARLRAARPPEPTRRHSGRINAREAAAARSGREVRRGGTLIVAPHALVGHWRDELLRRASGQWRGYGLDTHGGHGPKYGYHDAYGHMAFDTNGTEWGYGIAHGAPPDVLVTSEERLSREFRRVTKRRYSRDSDDEDDAVEKSPLLKHAWRRVIMDEGRHAGDAAPTNRLCLLSALTVESVWILTGTPTRGERGKARRGEAALRQVGRLLRTVREVPHVTDLDDSLWQARVVAPLVSGSGDAAAGALRDALRKCCVRHSSEDLQLPAPIRIVSCLAPSRSEALSLNAFCAFVQANLYLTTLEVADVASMDDGYGASLLNPRNRQAAKEAINNILLCCAGGGEMLKLSRPEVLGELRYLLERVHKTPQSKTDRAMRYFADEASSLPCAKCALNLAYLLVAPCGCLYCPECAAQASPSACAVCAKAFEDVEDDVRLSVLTHLRQLRCASNAIASILSSPVHSPSQVSDDRWEHPVERRSDGTLRCRFWRDTDDGRTIGCPHAHVASKRQKMPGAEAFVWLQPGVELKWREAQLEQDTAARAAAFDVGTASAGSASAAPAWTPTIMDDAHTKACHVLNRLESAVAAFRAQTSSRPVRAILFAEDRKILDWVGHYLVLRLGQDAVAQHWGAHRADELRKFRSGVVAYRLCTSCGGASKDRCKTCGRRVLVLTAVEGAPTRVFEENVKEHRLGRVYSVGETVSLVAGGPPRIVRAIARCGGAYGAEQTRQLDRSACRVLLLHHDGRHGLDLPFVTHIFLLRTIWDSSYDKQVVSRANRLGCEGPVIVDQVLARGTAEEALFDRVASRSAPASEAEKIDGLLRGLRLLRA